MEGVLDFTQRDRVTRLPGWDFCVTEFVRVSQGRLPRRVFHRYAPELLNDSRTPAGVPVEVQLLGSDPDAMAENAQAAVAAGVQHLDLNFGCPAKTVNRHQGGAVLLQTPERVHQIAAAVVQAVAASGVPVSAKMRLGYADRCLALDNAWALQAAGVKRLVVHARTRMEAYRPPAHWEWVGYIADSLHIPVLANGDLWTLADYQRCVGVSGVRDVMLGRAAMADPWLAAQIKASASGQTAFVPQWADLLHWLADSLLASASVYPEKNRIMRVKQWLLMVQPRWGQVARDFFEQIKRLQSEVQLLAALQAVQRPTQVLTDQR